MKESGVVTTIGKDKDLAALTEPYDGFGWKHIRRLYPMAIADIVGLATALLLSRFVGVSLVIPDGKVLELSSIQFGLTIAFAGVSVISLWSLRARDLSTSNHNAIGFPRIVGATSFASMLTAFVGLLAWSEIYDPRYTVIVWVLSIPMILIGEYLTRKPLRFESGFDPSIVDRGSFQSVDSWLSL
ncbi:MAG: hypothetical protein IH973_14515 [Myxococcales bacterium]|nr:hypothetical protein [Myxococcales bacterium]